MGTGRVNLVAVFVVLLSLAWPKPVQAQGINLSENLVSCWDMEEGSGARYDALGNINLTDYNTVAHGVGPVDYAAYFVGANSEYLAAADSPILSIGNQSFQFMAWFYAPAVPFQVAAKNGEWSILFFTDGRVYITVDAPVYHNVSAAGVSINEWHMVIGQYDSVSSLLRMRVDTQIIQTAMSEGISDTSGAFGLNLWGTDGRIDTTAIWVGGVSTDEELDWLYNSGAGRSCAELLAPPAPTPQYRSDIELSSGNHAAVDRTFDYGQIAIVIGLFVIAILLLFFIAVRLPKLWI